MNLKDKTEKISTAGHPSIDRIDAKPMNDQINKKIRENLKIIVSKLAYLI